jgi:hypothetical protein
MMSLWDERFSADAYVYGELPNQFFADQINKHKPGRILLPMEGEGRNAVYAAKHGWEVEAFDASVEGIKKAQKLAAKHGVTISYTHATTDAFDYKPERYDLVALVYAHLPPNERLAMHRGIANALVPGGMIVAELFHPKQLGRTSGGPKNQDMLYPLSLLESDFPQFETIYGVEKEVELDEGAFHKGAAFVTRYVSKKIR